MSPLSNPNPNPRVISNVSSWPQRPNQDQRRRNKFRRVAVVAAVVLFMVLDQLTLDVSVLFASKQGNSTPSPRAAAGSATSREKAGSETSGNSRRTVGIHSNDDAGGAVRSEEESAYSLALSRFWSRVNATTSDTNTKPRPYYPNLQSQYQAQNPATDLLPTTTLINSIRIPKAASSSLSVIARALAGCQPEGYPCCGYPGDPVGSCPLPDLYCSHVTGCTDHRPNYDGDEAVVTSLRDVVSRAVSAFFYAPPHTNVPRGEVHTWEKFVENVQSRTRRNVLTKMLNGAYAYDAFDEARHTVANAKWRLCRIAWFGMSEMPLVSSLMLYETTAFRWLVPNPVVFGLPPVKDGAKDDEVYEKSKDGEEDKNVGLRVNSDTEYKEFLTNAFAKNNGTSLVTEYNREDVEVYQFAKKLFCARLFSIPGLVEDIKRAGLGVEEMEACANVVGDGVTGDLEQLCPSKTA
ncbi:hypothetical protein HJC23_006981 [Cyclotella cryptica]|uniref:Uncharacterized protein n=1 Tax=Cyclotella cryptica TaxID=29204 RepID=A0ABD3QQ95_9STRA|eukprot:CCRYP_004315-RA/>CCRYP_004315-RA protein AED:0.02 eAED:0.02 QI:157/1/1/1/0/0/2/278/462